MKPTSTAREFEVLKDEILREEASRGQIRKFPKNVTIIQEGDAGDTLFIILAGKVKVYASDDNGREVVIDIFGPGEYVGEMMLDGGPRSASVMTMEPSTFAVVSRADLHRHIVEHPDIGIFLISR